ncbi:MAG TPA: cupin domain-containing protein [bacterium]|nr:cupin domain-containing protein [bacterium]
MKKLCIFSVLFLLVLQTSVGAQNERFIPSYEEESEYVNEHPEKVISVSPYVNTWKNSKVNIGHGGFAEQAIFTRGNPLNPTKKGAVLKYIKAYNHGFLYGNEKTEPTKHDKEQVVFYVMRGTGSVEAGGKSAEIKEGTGIFIPAGLEYAFFNKSGVALEVIIIVEEIPAGFKPRKDMLVKSYYEPSPGYWGGYTTHSLFSRNDGLAEPMSIFVVTVNNFGSGVPHYHIEGCEEIWLKTKGEENLCLLGKTLLIQNIGDAFLAPTLVPHSVINQTGSPMAWLYLGNRHDKEQ